MPLAGLPHTHGNSGYFIIQENLRVDIFLILNKFYLINFQQLVILYTQFRSRLYFYLCF